MNRHIIANFDEALTNLRNVVLTMGSLTSRSLSNTAEALFRRDEVAGKACIADDEKLDELEKQVDRDGIEVMLRYQPVATDLRNVISSMKISANLERVGDLCVGIARRALKLDGHRELPDTAKLEPVFVAACELYKDSMRAYADSNEALARSLKARDKDIDRQCKDFDRGLGDAIVNDPEHVRGYIDLIVICRNIERIADHATNIAEDSVYALVAEDIRHINGV